MAVPLRYEAEAASEITAPRNSLLVLGRGLGVLSVQIQPLRQLADRQPKPLVLLVNYKVQHLAVLRQANLVVSHIDEEKVTPATRKQFYQQKGLLSFSAKMVIVDLLDSTLNPLDVAFIFINDIGRLSTSSNERFLAELCLGRNPACFAKLFSEHAEDIPPLFDTLTRVFYLQSTLFLSRNHPTIEADLTTERTNTSEIRLAPSKAIQRLRSILQQLCLEALSTIKLKYTHKDLKALTFEACLLRKVHKLLKQSIDTNLRNLTSASLFLVQNVWELMSLYRAVETSDPAVLYSRLMQILKENEGQEASLWLNTQTPALIDELKQTLRGMCFAVKPDHTLVETHKPPRKWVELAKYVETCTASEGQWGSVLVYGSELEEDLQFFLSTRKLKAGDLLPNLHLKTLLQAHKDELLHGNERTEATCRNLEKLYQQLQGQFALSQEVAKRPRSPENDPVATSVLDALGYRWTSEYAPGWRVAFSADYDASVLEIEEPTHIVLFSYHLAIIREVERYTARRVLLDLPVPKEIFLLTAEGSAELHTLELQKECEISAFEHLARLESTRSVHIRPLPEPQPLDLPGDGWNAGRTETLTIVVDKREFGSSLPYELHKAGFRLVLGTLTVGDYVLTKEVCVERKNSGSDDIWQSLNSGRLLKQLHKMTLYYRKCVLLLEFQEGTAFSLSGNSEKYNITAKLGEVVMQFPRLTLLWSHGVNDTVRLFQRLKQGGEEPVLEEAQAYGKKLSSQAVNSVGRNVLMAMPGVGLTNIEPLIRRFGTIQGIAEATKRELAEVMGEVGGQVLFSFLEEAYIKH